MKNDHVYPEPVSLTGLTWLTENGDNDNSTSMSMGKQVARVPGHHFMKELGIRKANGSEIGY